MVRGGDLSVSFTNKNCNWKDNALNSYNYYYYLNKQPNVKIISDSSVLLLNLWNPVSILHLHHLHSLTHSLTSHFSSGQFHCSKCSEATLGCAALELATWCMVLGPTPLITLGAYWKWRFLDPTPDLLNYNLQYNEIPKCLVCTSYIIKG